LLSPCQSELKRTLRLGEPLPITVHSPAFAQSSGAHSTRMVNDRFPPAASYGFEMVDARRPEHFAATISSIENLHRIKSGGFFANFRPFKFNANTSGLSTSVSDVRIADQPQTKSKETTGVAKCFSCFA
jgi:hypothetical protein